MRSSSRPTSSRSAIAKAAHGQGFDKQLRRKERKFLYMPFQHSENLDDQNRAVLLFTELGDDEQLKYAKHHRDVIERFGRFPHRNAILGRVPRPTKSPLARTSPGERMSLKRRGSTGPIRPNLPAFSSKARASGRAV